MATINISYPETITDLNLGESSLGANSEKLGGLVNLSEFIALTSFVCIDNDIAYNDDFIPSNLIRVFNVKGNNITKFPRFQNYPRLRVFNFSNNSIQESRFQTNVFDTLSASLRKLDISDNILRGTVPSLSALSVLTSVNLSGNGYSSYNEISSIGFYNQNLTYFNLRDNTLSASNEINSLLLNLSGSGGDDGFIDISGPFMPKPSEIGLSARNSLLRRGWNVRSNELGSLADNSDVEFSDTQLWDFPNPSTSRDLPYLPQTVAWRISGYENMPITIDFGDGTPNQSLVNNLSTEHTFISSNPFNGVRYSLPHRIEKFVSRLSGGDFGTTSYPVSGNVNLSAMPGLLEVFVGDQHATFSNFNSMSRKLIQFYWWNNNVTDSFVDLNIARLPKLQTFSARGTSSSNKGDFTGELHKGTAMAPSMVRYNVQHNSLSGMLPTFTSNFNNIQIYFINGNENIVGEIPDMAEFGKNRLTKDVQFLANKCSLSGVTADFTVNSKLKSIKFMRNDFTNATLDHLMARLVASDLRGCTVDTRLQSTGQSVTPGNADLFELRKASRGNDMKIS